MPKSKKWTLVSESGTKSKELGAEKIIEILLENRGLESKKDIDTFLHPRLEDVTPKNVGIDLDALKKALKRIKQAIKDQEQIVVFGDYDVDGITGSAILWETLHELGAKCLPYIPNRVDEGYGLSLKGIENAQSQIKDIKLIITVDNGIVAHKAVDFANEKGIDVIITDHHTVGETTPDAHSIVHTTKLCGAGVAYLLAKELRMGNGEWRDSEDKHLELAALGTVADLVPLTAANRAIVTHGLEKLRTTSRVGLVALFNQSGINQDAIGVYEIGYIIGPRLNAAGRIESAMDSLRLLCTKDQSRATQLASKLELTNRERQFLLKEAAEHAITHVDSLGSPTKQILIVGHETYQEGVIGLVAGKLVEAFYRPAIVLSIGETHSKASARSVSGFNIIDFLRSHHDHFINVGGHPMAAGFTVETAKIGQLQEALEATAAKLLNEEILTRSLKIDMELPFSVLDQDLYQKLQQLAPFGMANPEPVFATKGVKVENVRVLGKEAQHLKLMLSQDGKTFEAIAFGMGELAKELKVGDTINVAYVLDENTWNGNTKLQMKIRDITV
jgi:single-stranded-DNA-specific exonuclease